MGPRGPQPLAVLAAGLRAVPVSQPSAVVPTVPSPSALCEGRRQVSEPIAVPHPGASPRLGEAALCSSLEAYERVPMRNWL